MADRELIATQRTVRIMDPEEVHRLEEQNECYDDGFRFGFLCGAVVMSLIFTLALVSF